MTFHDWHLLGYSVASRGTEITLHLIWDYQGQPLKHNNIIFSEVAAYNFMHTEGAIITDIEEVDVRQFINDHADFFTLSAKSLGLRSWTGEIDSYTRQAEALELRAWAISSAIGFEGFVVAKSVDQDPVDRTDQSTESNTSGISGIDMRD